jgi:RimJ/RimL family protein N-acetyltransferase
MPPMNDPIRDRAVSPVPLQTERLTLRELGVDDADFMLELLNDVAFLANIGDRGVRTLDDARAYIVNGSMASYARHGFGFWCVIERCSGARTGICGLARRESLDAVDIGFAFLPPFRACGYGFESASAVMHLARGELGLRRIVAIASTNNAASAALLERLGLRFERMIQVREDEDAIRLFAWNSPDPDLGVDRPCTSPQTSVVSSPGV